MVSCGTNTTFNVTTTASNKYANILKDIPLNIQEIENENNEENNVVKKIEMGLHD